MPPNFSAYINPGPGLKQYDFGSGFRALAQQTLQQKFHQDQVAHEQRVADDINSRYAMSLGEQSNARQFEVQKEHYDKAEKAVGAARAAAASGRWNEVEGMLGTLADLGVSVDKQMDPNGMPIYRFQNNVPQYHTGETYESAISKLRGQPNTQSPDHSQQDTQYHEVRTHFNQPNPFDALPGASAAQVQPSAPAPQTPQTQVDALGVPTNPQAATAPGTAVHDSAASETQQPQPQTPAPQNTPNPFDPNVINSAQINQMNAMRLDPVLSGIQQGFPSRYAGLAGNYLQSLKSLHLSPEATMEVGQKPLDSLVRMYTGELNAEGNMARASMQQGGQASSEARLRENEAYNRAERQAKDIGLYDDVKAKKEFASVREQLNSGNPNAVADGIKRLVAMTDGHRITDQDFTIALHGLASSVQELSNNIQKIYVSGLNPSQLRNFNQMLNMAETRMDRNIRMGANKMTNFAKVQRYEPEIHGVNLWIQSSIPQEYWNNSQQNYQGTQNQGGVPVRSQVSKTKSASATGKTTQEAADATKDEFNEFE